MYIQQVGKVCGVTLELLADQNPVNIGLMEVLIVDNNCTDGTHVGVVEAFRERLPIRRVTESRQGLAHARNRAMEDFRGDVLLFTDDDVRLGPGWLAAYQDAIHRFSEADYFGGRIYRIGAMQSLGGSGITLCR